MATRAELTVAAGEVVAADPRLAPLVDRRGPPVLRPRAKPRDRFRALCRSVAYQQLAGSAAAAIWDRVEGTVGQPFDAAAVLASGEAPLRSAGMSRAKTATVLSLAAHVDAGVIDLERIARIEDKAVVTELTQVKGIGRWTAEMFLLFTLHRLDVWPTGDLAVRNGYGMIFGADPAPTSTELEALGDRFRPYRSVVAWYCWQAVHESRGS